MVDIVETTETIFRIFTQDSGEFAIEITIPDSFPTTVKSFPTEAAAEAWIAGYRDRLEAAKARGKRSWRTRSR
jgi:ABC-type Fe3+-hydroxamate transport system substrate-binding protein